MIIYKVTNATYANFSVTQQKTNKSDRSFWDSWMKSPVAEFYEIQDQYDDFSSRSLNCLNNIDVEQYWK